MTAKMIVHKKKGVNSLQKKKPSRMQLLAKKLYAIRTRSGAEDILEEMHQLDPRSEYIEEIYLGLRDGERGEVTMADCRKLAKHYMRG